MQKPLTTLSTWAGAATLAGAMLLIPGAAGAQPGMNPGQPGPSTMPQAPMSPSQQQTNDQRGTQDQGQGEQQMEQMEARGRDSMFVRDALVSNMAEVQMGQLALQKSANPQVKQFAQQMIDDHTKLNNDMQPVAEQLGVKLPVELNKKAKKTLAKLAALSGTAFNHAYMKEMISDHKADLRDFNSEAARSQNPAVKTAAEHGAQVISAHLKEAEQIASQQTGGE